MVNHDIAFLHTSEVHVPTFQKLVDDIDSSICVRHDIDESLLKDAMINGITEQLGSKVDNAMEAASQSGATVVVCTCSTIGGVAEKSPQTKPTVSMRIDRAMADLAIEHSNRILIVAAVESTLGSTQALLKESSSAANKYPNLSIALVEGAWPLFETGKMEAYFDCIEQYIRHQHEGYDSVILAQASMAPVASRFQDSRLRVLASPELGVRSAIRQIHADKTS